MAWIDTAGLLALGGIRFVIACDVTNPLLGPNGASEVYGPQKGASAEMVAALDAALANYAAVIKRDLGKDIALLPGAGAAGGMGAGLMAFLDAHMQSGIDLVLKTAGFDQAITGADWVWTGEGRIDTQTLSGKTIAGILRRCQAQAVPVLAFGGSVDDSAAAALAQAGLRGAFPLADSAATLAESMRDGRTLLIRAAARVMRLLC